MTGEPFSVFVRGIPRPKGSKRPLRNKYSGKLIVKEQTSDAQRSWEAAVHAAIQEAWSGPPLDGPVFLLLEFAFLRPQSTPKRRTLVWREQNPDSDKLTRLVGDALEGVAYRNDSQVALTAVTKRYSAEPGVRITVQPLPQDEGVAVNVTATLATLLWHCRC